MSNPLTNTITLRTSGTDITLEQFDKLVDLARAVHDGTESADELQQLAADALELPSAGPTN